MLSKLKATTIKTISNTKIITKKAHHVAKEGCKITNKIIDKTAKFVLKLGVSANIITLVGFLIGLLAINFLSLENYSIALLCILINRFFDALDGAMARMSEATKFGVFFDATLDYTFYAGVIFGFALANPAQNAIAASFLLFAFTFAGSAMLSYAVIAYKNNQDAELVEEEKKQPFFLSGFAQGFETFTALVILCIIPSMFLEIAIILGCLCIVKALSVITTAYYNFEIAAKKK